MKKPLPYARRRSGFFVPLKSRLDFIGVTGDYKAYTVCSVRQVRSVEYRMSGAEVSVRSRNQRELQIQPSTPSRRPASGIRRRDAGGLPPR